MSRKFATSLFENIGYEIAGKKDDLCQHCAFLVGSNLEVKLHGWVQSFGGPIADGHYTVVPNKKKLISNPCPYAKSKLQNLALFGQQKLRKVYVTVGPLTIRASKPKTAFL